MCLVKEPTLEDVCLIVDFDGFHIGGQFRTREFGYSSLTSNDNRSIKFNLAKYNRLLSSKDKTTAWYCTNFIHGLNLHPSEWEWPEVLEEKHLEGEIIYAYSASKTEKKKYVAYKGGCAERDVLERLEIPCINLEDFGCPKYNCLPSEGISDCGFHYKLRNQNEVHCAQKECVTFARWVKSMVETGEK